MNTLNLSSLGTASDTGKKANKVSVKNQAKLTIGLLLVVPIFFIFIISFLISPIFFLLILVVLTIFSRSKGKKRIESSNRIFEQLALDNNWQANVVPTDFIKSEVFSAKNGFGSRTRIFKGLIHTKEFWLLHEELGAVTVIDTQLHLPTAYFMNATTTPLIVKKGFDALAGKQGLEHLSLEGDFDRSLILYGRSEERIRILSIVAPDFMASLLDQGSVGSVQMIDEYLIISSYSASEEHIRDLLETTEKLVSELARFR